MNPADVKWLIWSNEHNAWWAPNQKGYVRKKDEAGRYDFGLAVDLVMAANTSDGRYLKRQLPDETLCPDWEAS